MKKSTGIADVKGRSSFQSRVLLDSLFFFLGNKGGLLTRPCGEQGDIAAWCRLLAPAASQCARFGLARGDFVLQLAVPESMSIHLSFFFVRYVCVDCTSKGTHLQGNRNTCLRGLMPTYTLIPPPTPPDAEFHPDDFGLDLTELSGITGFLMNEVPDNLGHFYPPWASDPAAAPVKEEPFMLAEPATARPQQQRAQLPVPSPEPLRIAPAADPALDVVMGGTGTSSASAPSARRLPPKPAKVASAGIAGGGGVGATFRKTAAGGVTRRRSSSKEEQAKKRRERNRVLARRTRLRKKFFFQSLQQQVRSSTYSCCCPQIMCCLCVCVFLFFFHFKARACGEMF